MYYACEDSELIIYHPGATEYSNGIVHLFRWFRALCPKNECNVSGQSAIN